VEIKNDSSDDFAMVKYMLFEGFGGFQLLDLQDFPGQGAALVGMLDVFMDSKGLITPEAWREFCSQTVPLLKMEK
jgi:hypothetical protein